MLCVLHLFFLSFFSQSSFLSNLDKLLYYVFLFSFPATGVGLRSSSLDAMDCTIHGKG